MRRTGSSVSSSPCDEPDSYWLSDHTSRRDLEGVPRLFLNHDADYDWLIALEYGTTDDGQPEENWHVLTENFAYLSTRPAEGHCLGFAVQNFNEFDPDAEDARAIWRGPRFDVPVLGLTDATAGEIIVASRLFLDGESTINRHFFDQAVAASDDPVEAVAHWRYCLQCGDVMAHYGLGYTLYELGRFRDAYRHLRTYTEITPTSPWAWCWLGKAAEAMGETAEARNAYERALNLERDSGDETDAKELLDDLHGRAA